MRKWLWFGAASAFLVAAGVGWYTRQEQSPPRYAFDRSVTPQSRIRVAPPVRSVNDEETSDATDPSIVETSEPALTPRQEPWTYEVLPLPRVVLAPGMEQPPRPDAERSKLVRMPYADEEEILESTFNPVPRIMDSTLRKLNLFQEVPADPVEESEAKDVPTATPAVEPKPESNPAMDYHHQYPSCPYTGGCPYPYSRRP